MTTVFISYRREDTAGEARALYNELLGRTGQNSVFMDVDNIALGRDFRDALQKTLKSCDVMLVLIGRHWVDAKDQAGQIRLQDPRDFVRVEIEGALKRDILVTPILVQEAHMPAAEALPAEIRDLVYRNGFELSHTRWESDVGEMIRRLRLDNPDGDNKVQLSASVTTPDPSISAVARSVGARQRWLTAPISLTRRRAVRLAALAAAGTGAAIAVPSLHRLLSKPRLQPIAFDTVTVDAKGTGNLTQKYTATAFTEEIGSGVGIDMVSIPGGSFVMGSPADEPERQANEGPQHMVTLSQFFIGAFPITQAQWSATVVAHPNPIRRNLDPNPSFFKGIDLPVESITWNQAEELCLRLGALTGRAYRLPSEAEWEYACRAGAITAFCFGPTLTPELANYCGTGGAVCGEDDGKSIASDVYAGQSYGSGSYGQGPVGVFRGKTSRAATFPRNRFGLYDMHGNVWEYCLDLWSANYAEAPLDGSANLSGPADGQRILRGGSWSHNPAICRSAYRDSIAPSDLGWQGRIGVRVVCTI